MVLSTFLEIVVMWVSMAWHRSKAAAANVVKVRVLGIESTRASVDDSESTRRRSELKKLRRSIVSKASYRHDNANEKKRYEFRAFYVQFGETISTISACSFVVLAGYLPLLEGAVRLFSSFAMEYLAHSVVWFILEREGYFLCNVSQDLCSASGAARTFAAVFITVASLTVHESGNHVVAILATSNATAVSNVSSANWTSAHRVI